jgi:hypothetical protein
MEDQLILSEKDKLKLDDIVRKMISNKESDANIQFVVDDYKKLYGVKKKESTTPTPSTSSEGRKESMAVPSAGRGVQKPMPSTSASETTKNAGDRYGINRNEIYNSAALKVVREGIDNGYITSDEVESLSKTPNKIFETITERRTQEALKFRPKSPEEDAIEAARQSFERRGGATLNLKGKEVDPFSTQLQTTQKKFEDVVRSQQTSQVNSRLQDFTKQEILDKLPEDKRNDKEYLKKVENDLFINQGISLDLSGDKRYNDQNIFKDFVYNLASGIGNLDYGIRSAIGVEVDSFGLPLESSRQLQQKEFNLNTTKFEQDFYDALTDGDFSNAARIALNTTAQSAPLMGIAAAANFAGGPAASYATMAALSAAQSYGDVKNEKWFKDMSDVEALGYVSAMGATEAVGEVVGGRVLTRAMRGVVDAGGKAAAKKTFNEYFTGLIKGGAVNLTEESLGEAFTGASQYVIDNAAKGEEVTASGIIEAAVRSGAAGLGMAGIITGAGATASTPVYLAGRIGRNFEVTKINKALEVKRNAMSEAQTPEERYALTKDILDLTKRRDGEVKSSVAFFENMTKDDQAKVYALNSDLEQLAKSRMESTNDEVRDSMKTQMLDTYSQIKNITEKYKYDNLEKGQVPSPEQGGQAPVKVEPVTEGGQAAPQAGGVVQETGEEVKVETDADKIATRVDALPVFEAMAQNQEVDINDANTAQEQIIQAIDEVQALDIPEDEKQVYTDVLTDKFNEIDYYDNKTAITTEEVTTEVPVGAPKRTPKISVKPQGKLNLSERVNYAPVSTGNEKPGERSYLEVQEDGTVDVVVFKRKREVGREKGVFPNYDAIEYVESSLDEFGNIDGVVVRSATPKGQPVSARTITIRNRSERTVLGKPTTSDLNLAMDLAIEGKIRQLGAIPQYEFDQAYEKVTKQVEKKTKVPAKPRPEVQTKEEAVAARDVEVIGIGNLSKRLNKKTAEVINRYLSTLYSVLPDVNLVLHYNKESLYESLAERPDFEIEGYYNAKDKQIHVLVTPDMNGQIAKDQMRVIRHEILHPILDAISREDRTFQFRASRIIMDIIDTLPEELSRTAAARKMRQVINNADMEEIFVEFVAQFSQPELYNQIKPETSTFEKIVDFVNNILKFFGVEKRLKSKKEVFDFLNLMNQAFEAGQAVKIKQSGPQANAIKSLKFSIGEPEAIQFVQRFLEDKPSMLVMEKEILDAKNIQDEVSEPLLNSMTVLEHFAKKLNVPLIFVKSDTAKFDFTSKVEFLDDFKKMLGVKYGKEALEFFKSKGYDIDLDKPTNKVVFVNADAKSRDQAMFSYGALFFDIVKQRNKQFYSSVIDRVVSGKNIEGDGLLSIARASYEKLLEVASARAATGIKNLEFGKFLNTANIETKTQLAYIAISDALAEYSLTYSDDDVNNNKVVKAIVDESIKEFNEQLEKTNLSIEDFNVKSRLDDLSQIIKQNTELPSLSTEAYKTTLDTLQDIIASKMVNTDAAYQGLQLDVVAYDDALNESRTVGGYDFGIKRLSDEAKLFLSSLFTSGTNLISNMYEFQASVFNYKSTSSFFKGDIDELFNVKMDATDKLIDVFSKIDINNFDKLIEATSFGSVSLEPKQRALIISQYLKDKLENNLTSFNDYSIISKATLNYDPDDSTILGGYDDMINDAIEKAYKTKTLPILYRDNPKTYFIYYIGTDSDNQVRLAGIDKYNVSATYDLENEYSKVEGLDIDSPEVTNAFALYVEQTSKFVYHFTSLYSSLLNPTRFPSVLDFHSDIQEMIDSAKSAIKEGNSGANPDRITNSKAISDASPNLIGIGPGSFRMGRQELNLFQIDINSPEFMRSFVNGKAIDFISDSAKKATSRTPPKELLDKVLTVSDVRSILDDAGVKMQSNELQRKKSFDVEWVVPETYLGLDVIPEDIKGTTLKDTYTIDATYDPIGKNVYIAFSSDIFTYSNVPPYLDTARNFQRVVALIPKMFPDVEYATVSFAAAGDDRSHPYYKKFEKNVTKTIDSKSSSPEQKKIAEGIMNTIQQFEGNNLRRKILYNKAYARSVGPSFTLKSGTEIARVVTFSDNSLAVYAFNAVPNPKETESDYDNFNQSSYSGAANIERLINQYNGRLILSPEETKNMDYYEVRDFSEQFNAYSEVGEVIPFPKVLRNLNGETVFTKSAVKFSRKFKLDPTEEAKEDKALDKVAEASYDSDKEYASRMSAFNKFQKTIFSKNAWLDRQADVRDAMVEGNLEFAENLLTLRAGAFANATYLFEKAENAIYGKLSRADIELLDQLILMRRIIQIDSNWDERKKATEDSYKNARNNYDETKSITNALIREEKKKAKPDKKAIASLENDLIRAKAELDSLKERVEQYAVRPKHPKGLNAEQCIQATGALQRKLGNRKFNELNMYADAYFDQFRNILRSYYQNGLIDEQTLERFIKDDYEPRKFIEKIFENLDNEVFERAGTGLKQDVLKAIEEGSEGNLLMDSKMLLSFAFKAAEAKRFENIATAELAKGTTPDNALWLRKANNKTLSNGDVATDKYGNEVFDPADEGFTNVYYKEGGKLRAVQMRNDLYEQWQDMNKSFFGLGGRFKKVLSALAGAPILRIFATGYNPTFGFGLAVPEALNVIMSRSRVYGKDSFLPIALLKMAKDYSYGIYSKVRDKEILQDYFAHGGGMSFMSQEFRPEYRFKDKYKNKLEYNLAKRWDKFTKGIAYTGEAFEIGLRLAVYRRMIENLKQEFPDLAKTAEGIEKIKFMAAAEARDIVDFSKGGSLTKDLDAISPYLNVAFQATYATFKGIKDNPQAFAVKFAQYAGGLMGLVMYNILAYSDDDYEDIDPYIRHRYHVILLPVKNEDGTRKYLRIKKVQQLVPLTTAVETVARSWAHYINTGESKGYSEDEIKAIWENMADSVPFFVPGIDNASDLFSRIPTFNAIAKAFFNYDSFRNATIVPEQFFGKIKPYAEERENDKVEFFYKAIAKASESEFIPDISAPRLKAGVESVITQPSTNFLVGIAYGFLDVASRATAAVVGAEDIDLSQEKKETKASDVVSQEVSRALNAPVKIFIRDTSPKWRDYVKKGSKAEEIKLEEGTEDYIASEKIKSLARQELKTKKRNVAEIKRVLNSLPEAKRERIARKYFYELARTDEQRSMLSIRYAETPTIAAKMFYEKFGKMSSEEINDAFEDLKSTGFRPNEEFYVTFRELYNKK